MAVAAKKTVADNTTDVSVPVETPVKPARKPRTVKPKVAPEDVVKQAETVVNDVVNVANVVAPVVADVAPAPVSAVAKDVEVLVSGAHKYLPALETKTVDELRQLHVDAIHAESDAKRELHALRLRAANMATTVGHDADHEIMLAKDRVAEAGNYLKAVEHKLEGEVKDIWGTRFGF